MQGKWQNDLNTFAVYTADQNSRNYLKSQAHIFIGET